MRVRKKDFKSILGFSYSGEVRQGEISEAWSKNLIPEYEELCLVTPFFHDVKVFLDIGANTGLYSLVFASRNDFHSRKKVFAFEPQKTQAEILRKTVLDNNWQHQFFVHELALSNIDGEAWINNESDVSTGGSLVKTQGSHSVELVKLTTLDNFCSENKVESIDLIKIDVEGHEYELLMGGKLTIKQHMPIIFIELSPNTTSISETTLFLKSLDYQMYHLENGVINAYSNSQSLNHVAMIMCISNRFSHLTKSIAGKNIRSLYWRVFRDSSLGWPLKYLKYGQFQVRWQIAKVWHKVRSI
jgi:FkbM family methyltransferase